MTGDLPPIRILCVDDHPLLRGGIVALLQDEPDMQIVGECANGREAIQQFRAPPRTVVNVAFPGSHRKTWVRRPASAE